MLTIEDLVFAAIAALFLTWFINISSRIIRTLFTRSTEIGYAPKDYETVLKRCYHLFPVDNLRFNGTMFRRGMAVRVVTNRNKTIEGRFIGTNYDNLVCFLTKERVVAQELGSIEEIREV